MRDKLTKEFGFLYKQTNEIDAFNEQFALLRKLWMKKLCTPLEEVTSMNEQIVKYRQSTSQLKDSLRHKTDNF